jgi:tetratricopeptide (TPR) repeat protein
LAPTDPAVVFEVATLDAESGRWDDAMSGFRRAIRLHGGFRAAAVESLIGSLAKPNLAVELAGDDVAALHQVAQALEQRGIEPNLARNARARADELSLQAADDPDASATTLARAAQLRAARGEPDTAIELYRRALREEYGRNDWRLQLARLLASIGRTHEAIEEARIVQRGTYGNKEAAALIADLAAKATGGGGATTRSSPARSALFEPTTMHTATTAPATRPATAPTLLLQPPRR